MISVVVIIYLFWGTWQDLRRKKIENKYLWVGGILGMIFRLVGLAAGMVTIREWCFALTPGLLLLIFAKITNEKIGYGDGLVFLILGDFFLFSEVWMILQIAIFLVMIFSLILLCSRRVSREYRIPFLPFLWIAHILLWRFRYV